MPKTFYKKQRPRKLFFAPGQEFNSTAYGDEVLRDFLLWRREFYGRWDSRAENVLLSYPGDIGGAPVRTAGAPEYSSGIIREKIAAVRPSASALPALWAGDLILEAEKTGALLVNGRKTEFDLGIGLEAWAILDLFEREGRRELFVVGKPVSGKTPVMTEYALAKDGSLTRIDVFPLEATMEETGHIVCMGRHVFLVHDKKLRCYYLAPETGKLERVPLGRPEDAAALCAARAPVADADGDVFWCFPGGVTGFRIGSPAQLYNIALPAGFEAEKLYCRGDCLFISGKTGTVRSLLVCREARSGGFTVENVPVNAEIALGESEGEIFILSLERRMGRAFAIDSHWDGRTAKETSRADLGSADSIFYYFGDVVKDARYVGRNEKNEALCLK